MNLADAVAGADLSIAKSGLALHDGRLLTVTPTNPRGGYARLRPMAQALLFNLRESSLVIIEGYDPHPRGSIALVRAAEIGGIVRAGLLELGIRWLDCPPSTLKKFATGKGNANKEAVFQAAQAAGVNPQTEDEADAYWLRRIGLELTKGTDAEELVKLAAALAQPAPPRV